MDGKVEIARGVFEPYAFSVKRLNDPKGCTRADYVPVIELFQRNGTVKALEYEQDSKGVWHIHGIIILRKGFFRKKICPYGFNVKLVFLYDEVGWMNYIRKDQLRMEPSALDFKDMNLFNL